MPRFADDASRECPPEALQELTTRPALKGKARRQLQQEWAQLEAEPGDLIEESRERFVHILEAPLVRDCAWDLHSKAESFGHRRGPPLVGRDAMRPIEGGVDLHRIEALCVAFEMTPGLWKPIGVSPRHVPARCPNGSDAQQFHPLSASCAVLAFPIGFQSTSVDTPHAAAAAMRR